MGNGIQTLLMNRRRLTFVRSSLTSVGQLKRAVKEKRFVIHGMASMFMY